jgi:hypothetical protein
LRRSAVDVNCLHLSLRNRSSDGWVFAVHAAIRHARLRRDVPPMTEAIGHFPTGTASRVVELSKLNSADSKDGRCFVWRSTEVKRRTPQQRREACRTPNATPGWAVSATRRSHWQLQW